MNSCDPEELVVCPYDPVHRVARKRMQYHLIKCRKNYSKRDFKTCPFNARHVVNSPEFEYHIKDCPDRAKLDAEVLQRQQNDEGCRLKGNTSIPAYDADWVVPPSSENWDSDNVVVLPQIREGLYSSSSSDTRMAVDQRRLPSSPREPVQEPPNPRMPKMEIYGSQVFQYSLAAAGTRNEEGQIQGTYSLGRGRGRGRGMVTAGASVPGRMVGTGRSLTPQQIPALQPLPVSSQPPPSQTPPSPRHGHLPPPPGLAPIQGFPPPFSLPPPSTLPTSSGLLHMPSGALAQPAVQVLTEEDLHKTERKLRKMLRQEVHSIWNFTLKKAVFVEEDFVT